MLPVYYSKPIHDNKITYKNRTNARATITSLNGKRLRHVSETQNIFLLILKLFLFFSANYTLPTFSRLRSWHFLMNLIIRRFLTNFICYKITFHLHKMPLTQDRKKCAKIEHLQQQQL